MKHENEIVDAHRVLRALCGVLAATGLLVAGIGLVKYALAGDWIEVLFRLGPLFGSGFFGYFAITGRLPLPDRSAASRSDDGT
ncbi:hypothetical protein [Pseudoxanthomonas suwonensis]|nr:hypothetical protein [Pseudoxanthomonas suwonensis]